MGADGRAITEGLRRCPFTSNHQRLEDARHPRQDNPWAKAPGAFLPCGKESSMTGARAAGEGTRAEVGCDPFAVLEARTDARPSRRHPMPPSLGHWSFLLPATLPSYPQMSTPLPDASALEPRPFFPPFPQFEARRRSLTSSVLPPPPPQRRIFPLLYIPQPLQNRHRTTKRSLRPSRTNDSTTQRPRSPERLEPSSHRASKQTAYIAYLSPRLLAAGR